MSNELPKKRGNKYLIAIYVNEQTYLAIEEKRGKIKRSTYIEEILENLYGGQ